MSDLARWSVVVMVAMMILPARMHAQHSPEIAAQRARVDSLLPAWRAVNRELVRGDSVRAARRAARSVAADTAAIGPFVIIAPRAQSEEHFRNVRKAVGERAAMLQGLDRARKVELFVERDGQGEESLRFAAQQSQGTLIRIYGANPRVRLRSTRRAIDNALYELLPAPVRTWVGDADLGRGREDENVYRELATSPHPQVAACRQGDVDACVSALGLGIARTSALGGTARASFLMYALEAGDTASFMRLHNAARLPAEAAIEQAGGESLPGLVDGWKKAIARDYVSNAGLVRASASTLLWFALAALVALRSTRRRGE